MLAAACEPALKHSEMTEDLPDQWLLRQPTATGAAGIPTQSSAAGSSRLLVTLLTLMVLSRVRCYANP